MSAMLTADWCLLGRDTYYRKFEVYAMLWPPDINLNQVTVTVAPLGGPIAVVRDHTKFVRIDSGDTKPVIGIYSGSGMQISSVVWHSGLLIALGWTDTEQLLCIQEDGNVYRYDIFGTFQHVFRMAQESQNQKVIDAKVFHNALGTGVAVVTFTYKIFLVNNINDPKVRELAACPNPTLTVGLFNWFVMLGGRETEVLCMYTGSSEIYRLLPYSSKLCGNPTCPGNILEMALSERNNKDQYSLALFMDTGVLWIGSIDLKTTYCETELERKSKPKQMLWCDDEAVVCYWPGLLVVVNRWGGEIATYNCDQPLHLSQEPDCVRIISAHQHEILQKVPPVVQTVLRINSTDLGSYLLEASKHYQKRSYRADEYIGLVRHNIRLAVTQCIETAGFEFAPETQKMLMRAAQFGSCFAPNNDPDTFVTMCRELRVLNAVRDKEIGIPITYAQVHLRQYNNLLDRLVARRHYYLATQVAKYLQIPEKEGVSRVLMNWACNMVNKTQIESEVLAKEIYNKLGYTPGVSYSDIANKATECGRPKLAIKLLDYEPRARYQVPLLLKLNQDGPALLKAIESGDTDLVYTVIFHMKEFMPLRDFKLEMMKYPMTQALYIKHCKQRNPEALFDCYKQVDNFNAAAVENIRESLVLKTSEYCESIQTAQIAFKQARNDLHAFFCDETQRLLKHQQQLGEKLPALNFTGKSVHDTLYTLLVAKEMNYADRFRNDYKVPDRRYWWLRIKIFGEQRKWADLEKFSKAKKSPIGYAPFVDVCLKYGQISEAEKYLPKVSEDLKVKYYVMAGKMETAAQIAFEQKDIQALHYVLSLCKNDAAVSSKVNTYISQLTNKK